MKYDTWKSHISFEGSKGSTKFVISNLVISIILFSIIFYTQIPSISGNTTHPYEFKQITFNLSKIELSPESSVLPISIVMPIFNRLSLVNRSLVSAQQQKSPQIEIICVDDCSSEPISNFIIEKMKEDKRIKLVQHFYSQGSFHSRKNGVFSSKGRYIISIDSDDYLNPDSISPVYEYAVKTEADIIDYVAANKQKEAFRSHDWKPCLKNITNNTELMMRYYRNELSYNIWKRMIKRSVYLKALKFIYPFIKGKRLSRTEDVISLGSVFIFASNMLCTKFHVYVHFMFSPKSVEYGGLQSKEQTDIQHSYTFSLIHYLYIERKSIPGASLEEFLSNKTRLDIYNNITNINNTVHLKACEFNIDGFKHVNNSEYGFCYIQNVAY